MSTEGTEGTERTERVTADEPPATRHPSRHPSRRPRGVLALAVALVLAWLAVGAVGGQFTGRLSEVQKNDNASFLPKDAESTAVIEAVAGFTDEQSIPIVLVAETQSGTLTPGDLAALQELAASVPAIPLTDLGEGVTMADYLIGDAPIVPVPSQDGRAALIVVPFDEAAASEVVEEQSPLVVAATALGDRADETLGGTSLTAFVGGPGGLIADFSAAFAGIDGILLGVALLVVLVILLIVYRSPILPLAVLASALFGLSAAAMAVYPLAKNGVIDLSGQSQGILFILVVGAATDYALLLVSRYREELHDEPNAWSALKRAWRGSVEPIVASAATVILGLLCLLLASLQSTAGLGPVGALGIAGALLASLTFLPAVLLLFGRKVFWPFVPRLDHRHAEDTLGTRSLWGRVAGLVGRHPRRTWVTTLVVLLAAAAFAPTFKAQGVSVEDTFLTTVDSVEAQKVIGRHFPAGSASPVQVVTPEDTVDEALAVVTADPGVDSAFAGVAPPVPGQPAVPPAVVDQMVLIQATTTGAADSPEAEATVERLRVALDAVSEDALVGGNAAINLDVLDASARDLRVIVPTILAVIFVVLCLLLRSFVAPLILVAANVLSFAATIGVSAVLFDHVFGFAGSDPSIPLYGFVFLVALGIDYSIFLMTRVREEAKVRGTRPGILVGLAVTGGVITSAGIVLASTFSALAVLPLVFLVQVAFIVAFGVLLDTFVVRSLLVPAAAYDVGPGVWWPRHFAADRENAGSGSSVGEPSVGAPSAREP